MGQALSPRSLALASALAVSFLCLTGCSTFDSLFGSGDDRTVPKDARCPEVRIVPELGTMSSFLGSGTSSYDLAYYAQLNKLASNCDLDVDKATVTMSFRLNAERGPKAPALEHDFPYFVAIANPAGIVTAKQVFTVRISFGQGGDRAGSTEALTETIPYPDAKDAENYAVLVGLQLTPQERDYNLKSGVNR